VIYLLHLSINTAKILLKVLLINKTDSGGGAAVAANRLNRALRRNGIDSKLLVQDLKRGEEGVYAIGEGYVHRTKAFGRFVGERLYFLPHEKNAQIRFGFSPANTGIDISNHPLVQEADVIHLHWINQGFLSLDSLSKLFALGKPIIWTQHDMWAFTGGCHYAGDCHEFLESCAFCPFLKKPGKNDLSSQIFAQKRKIYNSNELSVVACSKWLRTLAQESKLLRGMNFYNIPNPIDTNSYAPKDKNTARINLNLPTDKKLILFGAAKVEDQRKGIRYFIEALNYLQLNYPDSANQVELIFFGQMSEKTSSHLPFKTHAFNFVKKRSTIIDLYNAADLYVLPSLQDNLPNTVMEALSCGTPVAGFSIGGVPEMISHGYNGFLAEVKNSTSLADKMYKALFLEDLNEISKNARQKALNAYSEKVVAAAYLKVYEAALNK